MAWRLRLLLSPVQTLPTRCVCNQPNPFAKDPEHFFKCAALRKISAFRRHQMVVWFIQSFVHRHGGTVVLGPTHIGGDPSKRQVDLRIRIGDLCADGDVHIHNPTSGNNTSKTPFAVVKRAAQLKKDKYAASSSKDGFEFFSLGAEDTGALDPEFKEFARRLARVCARQNPTLKAAEVQQEFAAGVIRTIHKGNEIIVRTADLRSMDALDPAERMPRQQRRAREAAFREVIEQAHQDQQQRERQQERSQRDANQRRPPQPASQANRHKASKAKRREPQPAPSSSAHHPTQRGGSAYSSKSRTSQRPQADNPSGGRNSSQASSQRQAASSKIQPGADKPSSSAQSQQQRTYSEVAAGQSGTSQQSAPATPSSNKWRHVTYRHGDKFKNVTKRSGARLERQRQQQTAMVGCDGDDTSAAEADSQATPASTQTEQDNPSYDGGGAGSGQASRPANNYTQPSKAKPQQSNNPGSSAPQQQ